MARQTAGAADGRLREPLSLPSDFGEDHFVGLVRVLQHLRVNRRGVATPPALLRSNTCNADRRRDPALIHSQRRSEKLRLEIVRQRRRVLDFDRQ